MSSSWDEQSGFAIVAAAIPPESLPGLTDEAERLFGEDGRRPAGVRRVLARSARFAALAQSSVVRSLVTAVLGDEAFVVRSLLFDKSPDANWDVSWHQDTTIAVAARHETAGFGPWSIKSGVPHVRPPADVLANMLTVRLHLDACDANNGPLLVAPGSHLDGIVDPSLCAMCESTAVACMTNAGGAVLMRPLLVHASRKAVLPTHRRVLHLEFAIRGLPAPLAWAGEEVSEFA